MMSLCHVNRLRAAIAAVLFVSLPVVSGAADERQSLEELRNTVVNMLQALVDKGILTREQAQQMVKSAQDKAAADAAAVAKADEGAVRVPYVPQIIKEEIEKQVAEQVKPQVAESVKQDAKREGWGIPGALPEWLSRVRVYGDVTVRGQEDLYSKDNSTQILDYAAINNAGSFTAAGQNAFLNTANDRERLRLRARLGVDAQISPHISAGIRLASGSLTDPGSESQTLGQFGSRYTVGFDQAYIKWVSAPAPEVPMFSAIGGRIPKQFFSPTELVFARDLQFEGLSSTFRFAFGDGLGADRSQVFATVGGFPVLEVPLANPENKWMIGGQIGTALRFLDGGMNLTVAGGYYDFIHVRGQRNTIGSTLLNYTAPSFIRFGNDYFDIANTINNSSNLFALASDFRLVDLSASWEIKTGPRYSFALNGEAVRNMGYNRGSVEGLTGQLQPRNESHGYVGDASFGDPIVDRLWRWRGRVGYRYVERDAVLDAWTDADFHEGGTNTRGYFVWADLGVAKDTWLRLRYMSGNEIDGPAYGLDVIQIDINTRF